MTNRKHLIESGWKQGVLLVPNDDRLKENAHYKIPDDAHLLIISQTCDLVQGSYENEPYFEVLCLHPLSHNPNGGYLGGKNSRRIEFSDDTPGDVITYWYALPFERHLIKRELLFNDLRPELFLDNKQTLKMILSWLSRRYTRTAFPEAFVSRINVRRNPIGKKFSRLNTYIKSVYVRLTPFGELVDDKIYKMEIMLVMDAEIFDDSSQDNPHDKVKEIRDELESQLNKCDEVEVEDISIESTASVTIEDLNGFLEWDYSYLSFREPDNAEMPADF